MLIIGIAGGSGSGKTTFVNNIRQHVNEPVPVLSFDNYYRDNSHLREEEKKDLNFDHPEMIDFKLVTEHINTLVKGNPVNMPLYSMITCSRVKETISINPSRCIILEGILALHDKTIRKMTDLKIYMDPPDHMRTEWIIARDVMERGRTRKEVLERLEKTVTPMHFRYVEPQKKHADIIVPGGGKNKKVIELISVYLNQSIQ